MIRVRVNERELLLHAGRVRKAECISDGEFISGIQFDTKRLDISSEREGHATLTEHAIAESTGISHIVWSGIAPAKLGLHCNIFASRRGWRIAIFRILPWAILARFASYWYG